MRYVLVKNGIVSEIIPNFVSAFPSVPATDRYTKDFLDLCVKVEDDSISISNGYIYKTTLNTFFAPTDDAFVFIYKESVITKSKDSLASYLASHPLTWTDGNKYSVTQEKQSQLTAQLALHQVATAAGATYDLKWNSTGGECTIWSYENLASLALAIGSYVRLFVSYQQVKEIEINSCATVEEIDLVVVDYESVSSSF